MQTEQNFEYERFKEEAIQGLSEGKKWGGADGVFGPMLKHLLESMLEGELNSHLAENKAAGVSNRRNGKAKKTVRSPNSGHLEIESSRDREGTFAPKIIPKRQLIITSELEDKVLSMYAKGMSTRDISGFILEMYAMEISATEISHITDCVIPMLNEWRTRPLEALYPFVFLDCIHYKVRENGTVKSRAIYNILGVNREGKKELLGVYVSENEGAKFWLSVSTVASSCVDRYVRQLPPPQVAADTVRSCGYGQQAQVGGPIVETVLDLPAPAFSLQEGNVSYGTSLLLRADSLPDKAVYEYSWDKGKSWVQGDSLLVCMSGNITARTRYYNSVSKTVNKSFVLSYQRVLIVGNSITKHGPAPEMGWQGNWGMAASVADSDYVHLLTKDLKVRNPSTEIKVMSGVPFEQTYADFDLNQFDESVNFKPDLIIMRIAENTNVGNEAVFKEKYEKLIDRLSS